MNSIDDRLTELESALDDQQARIEAHEETIAAQQKTIEAQRERLAAVENGGGSTLPMSRRGALAAGGALGLLGLGAGTASAAGSGQVGTDSRPLRDLYSQTVNIGETSGDFTKIESNDAGDLLEFTLGVYPDTPLRLEKQGTTSGDYPNVIAGKDNGAVKEAGNINGAAIGGGYINSIGENFGTIGGGRHNSVNEEAAYATIAGGGGADGTGNTVSGSHGTVGGGQQNKASGSHATVAGGGGGGDGEDAGNTAEGDYSSIPGGNENHAEGDYSFAAGHAAKAQHAGAFVVGNRNPDKIESKKENEARFQMNVVANAFELVDQQGEPTLDEGEGILYISDGTDAEDHNKGDLVYGYREEGENTKIVVIEDKPNNGGG